MISATTTDPRTETAGPATKTTTAEATTAAQTASNATAGTGTTETGSPVSIPGPSSTQNGETTRVAFEKGGSRVVVSGVITAENGCQEARLASVEAKGSDLVVTVGTERTTGTNALCTQALTPVEYRFALTPDTPPESVTVVHATMGERRTVTTVDRGG